MALITKQWESVTDDEMAAEGNHTIRVRVPSKHAEQGRPAIEHEEHVAAGWQKDPQGALAIRRRVRIIDNVTVEGAGDDGEDVDVEVDEVLLIDYKVYAPGEWIDVEAESFLYDPAGMLAIKTQREAAEAEQRQAATAARLGLAGNGNRSDRRAQGARGPLRG